MECVRVGLMLLLGVGVGVEETAVQVTGWSGGGLYLGPSSILPAFWT